MTGNQTMVYYVRSRHLYSHSRTCTRSSLCRRPSRLVASTICYLLDHASVHEISALVACSSICQTFPATMEILICYISSAFVEIIVLCISSSWRFWSMYIVRGDDHIYVLSCFMPIHGHCTLMYPGLLYVLVVMCRVWLLYCTIGWLVLPPGSSSLHFWDGLIMYFGHCMTALTSR